jgi:NAD(P)-dependent dehydrogenase (short-subunit alcohol dehydrogenase family)
MAQQRVALVTGGMGGLGETICIKMADAGYKVVATYSPGNTKHGEWVAGMKARGYDILAVACDVADMDSCSKAVAEVQSKVGAVDVLVNNAGKDALFPAMEEPVDTFRDVVEVNLVAPFALAQLCARSMVEAGRGGTIVNVASLWGIVGVGQIPMASYAASKGGLVNLTRELAAQWARQGVRVNTLAPGWFRTEMTEGRMFGEERSERWMRGRTPMGRGGEKHELDGALLFLAGDASSFVTGQVLCVDGGWTAI